MTASRLLRAVTAAGAALAVALAGFGTATEPASAAPAPTDQPVLGERPYMGWSSYSQQVYNNGQWITADQIMAQSDAMHTTLQPYGYEYINVDAGWNGGIDSYGRPTPSTTLYPNGLQEVIDHVHANGQKFGLYFIPGIGADVYEADLPIFGAPGCTTGDIVMQPLQQADYWGLTKRIDFSNPCAQAYIDSIADMLGQWGVDFVKFDSVTPGSGVEDGSLDARPDVAAWSQALARNNIWFEISWALDIDEADYWAEHANGWRIDWDVECYCGNEALTTWNNVERLFPKLANWWREAGPDRGWNDLDSMNIGNGSMDGLTDAERRTAMTLWSISAAPLYTGNDMTKLDDYGIELLTNSEVIAVNQAGRPARPVDINTNRQVWYSLNADGSYNVAVFNLGRTRADIAIDWQDLGLSGPARVRDLWSHRNLGSFDGEFVARDVPIHGASMFTITPGKGTTVTINDDDLRIGLTGDWQRNGGTEAVQTSQALTVAVGDSSTGEVPTAPAAGPVVVNDDSADIVYTGSWNASSGRGLGDYNDDVHWSETHGDSLSYSFIGTGIDYVTETDDSQGQVDVYLDGQFVTTVDASRPEAEGQQGQQVLYSVRDLTDGPHSIRLVHKTGQFMLLDKFDVFQTALFTPTTAAFDAAAPADVVTQLLRPGGELAGVSVAGAALTAGADYTLNGDTLTISADYLAGVAAGTVSIDIAFKGDHLNDVHATTTPGDAVEISFRGTSVVWSGPVAPDQGQVQVYLDGVLVRTVDTHSDQRLTNQVLFESGALKDGNHTVRLVMVDGDVMRFDSVTYTVSKVA